MVAKVCVIKVASWQIKFYPQKTTDSIVYEELV